VRRTREQQAQSRLRRPLTCLPRPALLAPGTAALLPQFQEQSAEPDPLPLRGLLPARQAEQQVTFRRALRRARQGRRAVRPKEFDFFGESARLISGLREIAGGQYE
jgi:hypothetical protein